MPNFASAMLAALIISLLPTVSPVNDTLLIPATVTALKESVSLDRIASPVSVIRKENLQRSGAYRSTMLSGMIPGLFIPEYGASLTSTIYLRGLGSRMENPVMGLYLDGIPVLDKNAYDFDWDGIRNATMLRGPQGTLYGRNSMGGVLSLQSLSPSDRAGNSVHLEYGTASSLRLVTVSTFGDNVISACFRHSDGLFFNEFKNETCDPYDGLSAHWKWERPLNGRLSLSNSLWTSLSKEGGFAYGQLMDGTLHPVSYNDEGSYARFSLIEGLNARWCNTAVITDATASFQLLSDNMRMDQDYTSDSIFTLQQRQLSGAGTMELRLSRADSQASWQPQTGVFALFKLNHMLAPVTFKQDGIQRLILDNANSHIPADIGYLDITDAEFPVDSDFLIGTWDFALFHESVFTSGKWQFTGGLRLDCEGGWMDYDCLASLHYRFVPTMRTDKPFAVPYNGIAVHNAVELLPKLSVRYEASRSFSLYATVSKGFRAGGFNTQIFSDILQNMTMNGLMKDLGVYLDRPIVSVSADDTEYAPESAWNYEAGARLKRNDIRAELSAYYIAVRNHQLTVFPPGMSTGRMMTNAGLSRSTGTEAELEWTPGDFRTRVAWSWCDARFVEYNDGNNDYGGRRIPYVPQHTLHVSAGYSLRLDKCTLESDAFLHGEGPFWWNETNTICEPFRCRFDGRVAVVFPKAEIYVRGENLSNTPGHSFYFKSMGNEFLARIKPRLLYIGTTIKF